MNEGADVESTAGLVSEEIGAGFERAEMWVGDEEHNACLVSTLPE